MTESTKGKYDVLVFLTKSMIPGPLLDDILDGKCLPFVGAGFSLNADLPPGKKMVDWNQLVEKLAKELDTTISTPLEIAQEYENSFGRPKLIETLENILQIHIIKPGEVHRQFVKSELFDLIYTTNFDSLLEGACDEEKLRCRTIVTPKQISLIQGHPTINIIKMHGELPDIEYLIFTKADYENYEHKYDSIVSHLKGLLTTKTVLFLGYSLRDPNFQQIKQMVEKMMGVSLRKSYIVLLNADNAKVSEYEKMNLHVINLQSDVKTNSELLLDFIAEIKNYKSLKLLPPSTVVVSVQKSIVIYGETLEIRAQVSKNIEKPITLTILDSKKEIVYRGIIDEKMSDEIWNKKIVVRGSEWKIGEEYVIIAEYDGKITQDKILISEQLPIVVQTDKSVYLYNSDMIVTVINPNRIVNTPMNLEIFGPGNKLVYKKTIPIEQTGTGIYQDIVRVGGKDWSRVPGSQFKIVTEFNGQTAVLDIYTSNFGATVILDQKVYTWTDRVYITVVAPDFNHDPNVPDVIGDDVIGKITIATKDYEISSYKLVETGPDTGIFTGYVILTGNPNIKGTSGLDGNGLNPTGLGPSGVGPIDGVLPSMDNDQITVSFNITPDQKITASAIVRWNVGRIKWHESSYAANSKGVLQIVDPDMNLNPTKQDKFIAKIWSDSDSRGIVLTMEETTENSGIFQGTVNFKTDGESIGNNLKVEEGDTVTAEYIDRTLPPPYTSKDQIRLTSTTFIGSTVSPLERVTILNSRILDSSGNFITSGKINEEICIGSDLVNEQDREQSFAYVVQVQDANGVTVSLLHTVGRINANQSHTAMLKWTPLSSGIYVIQIFVWKRLDNPNAMAPPLAFKIKVV